MKKVLFALLLVLPFVFNSCSSDDDEEKSTQSLNKTTWELVEKDSKWEDVITLTFNKSTYELVEEEYQIKIVDGKEVKKLEDANTYKGTYTYDHPNGTIKGEEGESKFIVNGKTLTIKEDDYTMVFTKNNLKRSY
ncbi:MAG: hypothetical protein LUD02_09780 [Tannerellaceae bacterium]|nr:hypothetical protein [Tannerellaceae bacterium]